MITRSVARAVDIQENTPCPDCGHLNLKLTSYIPADGIGTECWTGFCQCARDNKAAVPLSAGCDATPVGEITQVSFVPEGGGRAIAILGRCGNCRHLMQFVPPCRCEWEA